jgi:hypothetical protein
LAPSEIWLQPSPAFDEAGDQEAVEGRDVGARAGGEIERQLLGHLLVLAAELVQRHGDILALGLHLLGEFGDHAFLDPHGGLAVHAADDAAADDGEINGECRGDHGGSGGEAQIEGT